MKRVLTKRRNNRKRRVFGKKKWNLLKLSFPPYRFVKVDNCKDWTAENLVTESPLVYKTRVFLPQSTRASLGPGGE